MSLEASFTFRDDEDVSIPPLPQPGERE